MDASFVKKTICMLAAALLVTGVFSVYEKKMTAMQIEEAARREEREAAAWEAVLLQAEKTREDALTATEQVQAERAEREAAEAAEEEAARAEAERIAAEEALKERMKQPYAAPYVEREAEKQIYSYVQSPVWDCHCPEWVGYWSNIAVGNQKFSLFGCGLCCLSNVVSTLTEHKVNPAKMFWLAQEISTYRPKNGQGAIDWTQMTTVLDSFYLKNELKRKPASYQTFKEDVAKADAVIVLLCKDDDDSLWFYTNGHYVTLWEYDPNDGTVFVSDSACLYNRTRVALAAVYKALKTKSTAQYLCVYR